MTQLEGDQVDQLLEAVAARLPATWPQWGGCLTRSKRGRVQGVLGPVEGTAWASSSMGR